MRSRFVALLTVALMAVLWGCTSGQQQAALSGGSVVAGALAFDQVLQSGDVERAVLSVELSPEELQSVVAGFDQYAVARDVLRDVVDNPERVIGLRGTLETEHARIVQGYGAVQAVVSAHWPHYGPVDQARLLRWQAQAERLEIQYNNFLAALDSEISENERYQRLVEVLRIVAQLALLAV